MEVKTRDLGRGVDDTHSVILPTFGEQSSELYTLCLSDINLLNVLENICMKVYIHQLYSIHAVYTQTLIELILISYYVSVFVKYL